MSVNLQPFACYAPKFYPELISVLWNQAADDPKLSVFQHLT